MENSAFTPNPLTSPALVVFSTPSGILTDSIRMQRAFNPQPPELKDLPGAFSSSFGVRPLDHFSNLNPLLHMQAGFLHPSLESHLSFSGGAFQPISSLSKREQGRNIKDFGSAFAPPVKSQVNDPPNFNMSVSGEMSPDENSVSERLSPFHLKEEKVDPGIIEKTEGEVEKPKSPERSSKRKRKSPALPKQCSVCGLSLRPGEISPHYAQEIDRLRRILQARQSKTTSNSEGSPTNRWESYQRIRLNRQNRLRAKTRRRKHEEAMCPVCNEKVCGGPEDLNAHVDECLKKQGEEVGSEGEEVDVEGEQYSWAGQTRVRASSLLHGGYRDVLGGSRDVAFMKCEDDDDMDLIVDGDDCTLYGPAQFSQTDVIDLSTPSNNRPLENNTESEKPVDEEKGHEQTVIKALRAQVKELGDKSREQPEKSRCNICYGGFVKPLVSIACWHVYCEDCWLKALGEKKLCPHCNMITAPSDLRRVFL